jgi:hypothetical protein
MRCFRSAPATAIILLLLVACGADSRPAEAPADDGAASAVDVTDASARDGGDSSHEGDGAQEAELQLDAGRAPLDASEAPRDTGTPQHDAALDAEAEAGGPDAARDAGELDGGPVASLPKAPFGVGSHWNEISKYATLRAAGVQMMRIDLSWDELEPTQGSFDWPKIDSALAEAAKQGIEVLAVVGYTPSWARSSDSHNFAPREGFDTA